MEKRSRHSKEKQRQVEKEDEKTPFQKMLDDRAKRLEMLVRIFVFCFENCSDLFREKSVGIRKIFVAKKNKGRLKRKTKNSVAENARRLCLFREKKSRN